MNQTTKQVFFERGKAIVHEVPLPPLEAGMILIAVAYSFISSGTENATRAASGVHLMTKVLKNTSKSIAQCYSAIKEHGLAATVALIKEKSHPLFEPGYAAAGRVIAVGPDVHGYAVGDLVACAGAGFAVHAGVVAVPVHLVARLTSMASLKHASCATVGAIALQGVRRADIRLGDHVAVIGLGLLGLLTVQLVRASGGQVMGVDIDTERCRLARTLGCASVYTPEEDDVRNHVAFATDHQGVDATIITAASASADLVNTAIALTRRKGTIIIVGDVALTIEREPLYEKEIDVKISCSYGPGRYDPRYERDGIDYPYAYVRWTEQRNLQLIAQMIEQEKLLIQPLISHEFVVDDASKAYESLGKPGVLGVILRHHAEHAVHQTYPNVTATPFVRPQGRVRTAIVGMGGFCKTKLLPLLQQCPAVDITRIIDTRKSTAMHAARIATDGDFATDYHGLVHDATIDLIVLATPHAQHSEQACTLLSAGKAVFLEKPAAVRQDQLNSLATVVAQYPEVPFVVDFNRSWAPFNQQIKQVLAQRHASCMISYRMNAGFLPRDHWIQSAHHAGRLIGEGCHIIDLFLYLVDAPPRELVVRVLGSGRSDMRASDNVLVTLTFEDGSVAQMMYTALGNTQSSKERMEIFSDGASIIMDDYRTLEGHGLPRIGQQVAKYPDKGHGALLRAFIDHVRFANVPPPIPWARIFLATKLTIIAETLASQGGGSVSLSPEDVSLMTF